MGSTVTFLVWFQYDNLTYANRVFEQIRTGDVLASRRWHSITVGYGCTFAVVELPEDAAVQPPAALSGRKHPLNMPSNWQRTPGENLSEMSMGWFAECREDLGDALFDRMSDALEAPGGWWNSRTDTVFLYSRPARLAFRLRHGD
ncbi:MAG: hypothetical protein AAGA06_04830 [Pseudomonadota bacterium]